MRKTALAFMAVSSLALAGCQTLQNSGTKQTAGGLGGAVLGGLAGAQVGSGSGRLWATGAGVLLGTLVGSEIGKSLDRADMAYLNQANSQAHSAPIGETIQWNNPETGNSGAVTPVRDGYAEGTNRYCREYQQTIYVGGQQQTGYGTACQQPDGTWEIIS